MVQFTSVPPLTLSELRTFLEACPAIDRPLLVMDPLYPFRAHHLERTCGTPCYHIEKSPFYWSLENPEIPPSQFCSPRLVTVMPFTTPEYEDIYALCRLGHRARELQFYARNPTYHLNRSSSPSRDSISALQLRYSRSSTNAELEQEDIECGSKLKDFCQHFSERVASLKDHHLMSRQALFPTPLTLLNTPTEPQPMYLQPPGHHLEPLPPIRNEGECPSPDQSSDTFDVDFIPPPPVGARAIYIW